MKICSITPLKNADLMYENDYVMLLAHLSKKYSNYAVYARNNHNYKIMDNSIIELGESFSMQELIDEAIKCDVNEIILPDVFNDGAATIKRVRESIQWLKDHNYMGRFKLMAVCHAKNHLELINNFDTLNDIPEIDTIGFPKVLSLWLGNSRAFFVNELCGDTDKQIHLLGCWYSLTEFRHIDLPNIRSMDTCLPALLSVYDMDTWDDREGRKIDLEDTEINLKKYKKIINEFNSEICK